MNLQSKIMQAEASLSLKKLLFRTKRCQKHEVDIAEDFLNSLLIDAETENIGTMVMPLPTFEASITKIETPIVEKVGNYDELQAELSATAKKLSDELGDISNEIVASYKRNPAENVKVLMNAAIAKRAEIETVWDKKKFLERDGYLKVVVEENSEESEKVFEEKLVLAGKRKQIKDQIYKLEKKIADPTKHVKFNKVEVKTLEWQKELMVLENELETLELKISTK